MYWFVIETSSNINYISLGTSSFDDTIAIFDCFFKEKKRREAILSVYCRYLGLQTSESVTKLLTWARMEIKIMLYSKNKNQITFRCQVHLF